MTQVNTKTGGKLFPSSDPGSAGAVECLGLSFKNEDERRKHFREVLRTKLRDPEFRKTEGFPKGSDDEILALSDPPYYTACPNPFLKDFLKFHAKNVDGSAASEPFAADVAEGRHTWLYKAHTYHTKVPPKAIQAFLSHYTRPGDVVLDGFCGSGMTAVASMLADKTRNAFVCDIAPAASFIAASYLAEVDPDELYQEATRIIKQLDEELGWMYAPGSQPGKPPKLNYYVWSDVFLCASCGKEIIFYDAAFDPGTKEFADTFNCPHCDAENRKQSSERASETSFDPLLKKPWSRYKQIPVLAAERTGTRRAVKREVTKADRDLLEKIAGTPLPAGAHRLAKKMLFRDGQWGDQWKNCMHLRPITHAHQLMALRQVHYVGRLLDLLDFGRPSHRAILFLLTSVLQKVSRLMVYNADGIGRVQKGTLYISSVWQEMRLTHMLSISLDDLIRGVAEGLWQGLPRKRRKDKTRQVAWAGSASALPLPNDCIDYVFIDPPFGANIPYSELNFLWECVLGVHTNTQADAVESDIQGKSLMDYQEWMRKCFREFYRVLKPGRWMTVEFHNSQHAVWNAIQEALGTAGFLVADVRFLDKKQKSFKQATTAGAVKTDLIISAYKPEESFQKRFGLEGGSEEAAWAFIREHLHHLPVYVEKNGQIEVLAQRQPFMLFDRMVAFHVQRGVSVPISAGEFYDGLNHRFVQRDGMYFLSDQVSVYDRKRGAVVELVQLDLFVTDEASALRWLRQELMRKPQTMQELHPIFTKEINWEQHETPLELSHLLAENFLSYDGLGEVPPQIHAYLSSNFKELRNLPKGATTLREKGKDRWYVPDPRKQGDLEKLREKSLLREFEEYLAPKLRTLKVFRTEAVRAGFKAAYDRQDYKTIVGVAAKVPESVLQEDEKLLMYYDVATMRLGDEGKDKLFQ